MTTQDTEQPPTIPMADLSVVAEMQMGLFGRMMDVHRAKKEGQPVVWCPMCVPKEILYAMDVSTIYIETLVSIASMSQLAGQYCQTSEELGLSRDACAFHKGSLGICHAQSRDPLIDSIFVAPDIAISMNYPCKPMGNSAGLIGGQRRVPDCFVDVPVNNWGKDLPDHAVEYCAAQLEGLIRFLESHGYKMDWDRLKEEVAFSKALNTLLEEIEVYKRAVPTPMSAYDSFIVASAPTTLPASLRTLAIFERLRDDLKERVEKGVGVVENEKVRLLWIGLPPLCDFHLLSYHHPQGAVVAKNMVELLVGFPTPPRLLDPEKPLESIARGLLSSPTNPLCRVAIDWFVQQVKDYKIDGVVSVVKRTCSLFPSMQRLAKEAILKEAGVPSIIFDVDGVDEREHDATRARASLDPFVESLLAEKSETQGKETRMHAVPPVLPTKFAI
jgi:benzoyl-CoA reductase subunit B